MREPAREHAFWLASRGAQQMDLAVRLHPAEAAARLFTRTFPPIWDRQATTRVVNACGGVAEQIPAFLLRFRRDATAIEAARRAAASV